MHLLGTTGGSQPVVHLRGVASGYGLRCRSPVELISSAAELAERAAASVNTYLSIFILLDFSLVFLIV